MVEDYIQKLLAVLQDRAETSPNPGLMNGKTGVAIVLFLTRQLKVLSNDRSDEWIDGIISNLNLVTPNDFQDGLAGIGWGLEFLIQNGFVEADADEVFEEIDYKLARIDFYSVNDIRPLSGLLGYVLYFIKRLQTRRATINSLGSAVCRDALRLSLNAVSYHIGQEKDLLNEPHEFQIDWSFSALIFVLAECRRMGFRSEALEKLTIHCASALNQNNFPDRGFNKLLVKCAIANYNNASGSLHSGFIDKIELDNNLILEDALSGSPYLQNGAAGIAILYKLLSKYHPEFVSELDRLKIANLKRFTLLDECDYGLLRGQTGLLLCHLICNQT